jgi:hypothetical protein
MIGKDEGLHILAFDKFEVFGSVFHCVWPWPRV